MHGPVKARLGWVYGTGKRIGLKVIKVLSFCWLKLIPEENI
jgi:hypothetical protein